MYENETGSPTLTNRFRLPILTTYGSCIMAMNTELTVTPISEKVSLLDDQMVDMMFITKYTGMTDKWFYKLISEGKFPHPIKLGRSSRWLKSEVENWLTQKIIASKI